MVHWRFSYCQLYWKRLMRIVREWLQRSCTTNFRSALFVAVFSNNIAFFVSICPGGNNNSQNVDF